MHRICLAPPLGYPAPNITRDIDGSTLDGPLAETRVLPNTKPPLNSDSDPLVDVEALGAPNNGLLETPKSDPGLCDALPNPKLNPDDDIELSQLPI